MPISSLYSALLYASNVMMQRSGFGAEDESWVQDAELLKVARAGKPQSAGEAIEEGIAGNGRGGKSLFKRRFPPPVARMIMKIKKGTGRVGKCELSSLLVLPNNFRMKTRRNRSALAA